MPNPAWRIVTALGLLLLGSCSPEPAAISTPGPVFSVTWDSALADGAQDGPAESGIVSMQE